MTLQDSGLKGVCMVGDDETNKPYDLYLWLIHEGMDVMLKIKQLTRVNAETIAKMWTGTKEGDYMIVESGQVPWSHNPRIKELTVDDILGLVGNNQ